MLRIRNDKIKLFDEEDSDNETNLELVTNKPYAKVYNEFRKKEILNHLKNFEDDDDESSTDDDASTDEELVNPEFDKEFFKTLAYLKNKDPKKYTNIPKFFENSKTVEETVRDKQKTKSKSISIKDYERKLLLEKNGLYEDEEENNLNVDYRAESPTYVEEQEKLREDFKRVLHDSSESETEEAEGWGKIFKKRSKTKEEEEKEENDYLKWLAGQNDDIGEDAAKLKPLKEYWNNKKLAKDEMFLKDYLLNKRYLGRDGVPTYDEIVGGISEDDEEFDKQEEFEYQYNFRYEEPDTDFTKRYPRVIGDTVRVEEASKRKEKRQERKERKDKEKELKKKELEELKAIKRLEILDKIQKLKEIAGKEDVPFNEDELESEFDPAEHDKRMKNIFSDDYYLIDEGDEKPEFPELDDELGIEDWDNFDKEKELADLDLDKNAAHCEDDEFNMDADYDPEAEKLNLQDQLIENSRSRKKRRKRVSRFAEVLSKEKPIFDPEDEKTYGEYIDEYYKMDYEDIIGDTPCRFKYVETVPNDFGLTFEEILLASNKELNKWATIKKTMQIRPHQIEMNDVEKFKRRANNMDFKKRIFVSVYGNNQEDSQVDENITENKQKVRNTKKIKGKANEISTEDLTKKRRIVSATVTKPTQIKEKEEAAMMESPIKTKKKKDKNDKSGAVELENPDEELNSIRKFKKKQIKVKNNKLDMSDQSKGNSLIQENSAGKLKKNKRVLNKAKNKEISKGNQKNSTSISDDRLIAYGINPKKYHNKIKYSGQSSDKKFVKKEKNRKKIKNM